jgi:CBS domain-containing protein
MKRWLYVTRTIDRPAEDVSKDLAERVESVLADGVPVVRHADGSFATRLEEDGFGPFNPRMRVHLGVVAHRPDGRAALPIAWTAEAAKFAFPTFAGTMELEPLSSTSTSLVLFGSYVPPLGLVGAAADAAVLHRAADAAGRAILDRFSASVGAALPAATTTAKRDAMTVRDVMSTDVYVLYPDLPLKTAALMLFHLDISGAPVVSDDGDLIGVLTESDLCDKEGYPRYGFGHQVDESWRRHDAVTVGDACSRPARTTAPDVPLHDAVTEMRRLGIRRLVVVDAGRIAGIITRHDAVAALVRTDEELQQAVDKVLEETGEADVAASVEWGVVRLDGSVSRRSRVGGVVEDVRGVDGVITVDDSLTWKIDDVTTVAMPYV